MVVDWTDDASVDKLEPVLDDVCRGLRNGGKGQAGLGDARGRRNRSTDHTPPIAT